MRQLLSVAVASLVILIFAAMLVNGRGAEDAGLHIPPVALEQPQADPAPAPATVQAQGPASDPAPPPAASADDGQKVPLDTPPAPEPPKEQEKQEANAEVPTPPPSQDQASAPAPVVPAPKPTPAPVLQSDNMPALSQFGTIEQTMGADELERLIDTIKADPDRFKKYGIKK